jgi:hypothetical protein
MQMTLGSSLLGLGYAEKAIALFTRARATFATRLGPDHPDTLMSMNDLASAYRDAGKYDRARPLFEETLALRKSKLGPDHPDTLQSMSNLALFIEGAAIIRGAAGAGEVQTRSRPPHHTYHHG